MNPEHRTLNASDQTQTARFRTPLGAPCSPEQVAAIERFGYQIACQLGKLGLTGQDVTDHDGIVAVDTPDLMADFEDK